MQADLRTQTTYSVHAVYRRTERWLTLDAGSRAGAAAEVQALLDRYGDRVSVRGTYSAAGFRPDADVVFWLLSPSPDDLHELLAAMRRTTFGRTLDLVWAFWGLTRPPEFVGDHITAFQKGIPPRKYLQLYPFVRTAEWYLLPKERRGELLREHGMLGREFPEVLTNNVQAFGLGDYEWILAFETDEFARFVDMIRRLREAEARRYTQLDTPFILAVRKPLAEVLADLG
ncbi:MAG: chlorite dismutase family protein [Clostridia bacterium]|nr:chlorite dismutase family protein [Clostridia bacterium]